MTTYNQTRAELRRQWREHCKEHGFIEWSKWDSGTRIDIHQAPAGTVTTKDGHFIKTDDVIVAHGTNRSERRDKTEQGQS